MAITPDRVGRGVGGGEVVAESCKQGSMDLLSSRGWWRGHLHSAEARPDVPLPGTWQDGLFVEGLNIVHQGQALCSCLPELPWPTRAVCWLNR